MTLWLMSTHDKILKKTSVKNAFKSFTRFLESLLVARQHVFGSFRHRCEPFRSFYVAAESGAESSRRKKKKQAHLFFFSEIFLPTRQFRSLGIEEPSRFKLGRAERIVSWVVGGDDDLVSQTRTPLPQLNGKERKGEVNLIGCFY